ncbi:bifunctional diguanylate cyclase/phosphodiesterase [Pseudocolwellia sp. AS88]|uniref:putative bifunctional diguanylate cyclase/phosphodiesterase n=1 Tax=Pseudocolwellia sp. AS88 TaxID=3063958 RepID=UPI0026E9309A|nr:bifunctional diguanylate cyclase/phosphodiesterase [Pseudocolwellia sp. AS88]MDO7086631.1 bifunctional diguanylate cyclase/phosphodiesterase [Pseudocolwellia sp. AS88]
MSKDVEKINLDSDLRRHLLLGTIGLVVAVLIIFINVTYDIANDLGESLESEHIEIQVNEVAKVVDSLVTTEQLRQLKDNLIPYEYFASHHYFLDEDVLFLNVLLSEKKLTITGEYNFNEFPRIVQAISDKKSESGFTQLNDDRVFWQYKYNEDIGTELIFARKVHALDRAISYMSTRLSIGAFVTFWLAVWAALIISTYITQRFIKGNVRLNYLANHDNLTNLPNRTYLYEIVNKYFKQSKNTLSNKNASMLFIDLNKFKLINDSLGHHSGDLLLATIAMRLNKFVTKTDYAFRYGGDEFIIWSENTDQAAAQVLAAKVIEACKKPLNIQGSQFEVSVSIGIACYPEDGKNFNDIFKHADIAMYHAKHMRLGHQSYQKNLDIRSSLKVNLSGQLSHALLNEQFVLYYQPKVNISDGKTFGAEALIRWQHPVEGLLTPNFFISLIEQSDFVHAFTRYVFKQAIMQCRSWMNQGYELSVAVNISPYNLLDAGLVEHLKDLLEQHKVPASLIEIELTESATMVDIDVTKKIFKEFKNLGVKLSIDDFGTGMSSLSYIKELEVDFIKIDRSFIINIVESNEDEAIVMSILLLCQKLNRDVIIEGIETKEQRDKLLALGCKYAQGYYFGKPMLSQDLTLLLGKPS